MDIPRKSAARSRQIRRILYVVSAVAALALITAFVSRLKPAAPSVEANILYPDTVKRGSMLRQVRGLGTLIPEEIRLIPALSEGRVERILVRPGATVTAGTVLLELSNPQLEQNALEAESQLQGALAEYTSLRVRLESQTLDQKAAAATVRANFSEAKLQAEVNEELAKQGLIADLNRKVSKVRAEELATRNDIEEKRLNISREAVKAQLAVQQSRVEELRALAGLRRKQVNELSVRAGINGVLQLMQVQEGQQVTPGTNLARVANPDALKAELRIAETQAKDILIGQPVTVDTRNGIIQGSVSRIDPAVQNGTVTVDVALTGELPKGARPDLSVDGTIELERLESVLYMGRPVHGQENSQIGIFRIEPDGQEAVRVTVRLGRSSVNAVEILDGLKEGDRVILSDTSQWDSSERIRLK
ncbi:MAG TPA: HlyD family efflux transporter periplasmic adaptor subunit [Blastocatellia bacterium]|nr:HlyD family efflux transporter periplasmic adaptor subunit [Blastocatellia bacterium]